MYALDKQRRKIMKKIVKLLALFLALLFVFPFMGCSKDEKNDIDEENDIDILYIDSNNYCAIYVYEIKDIQLIDVDDEIVEHNNDTYYFVCTPSCRYSEIKTINGETYYESEAHTDLFKSNTLYCKQKIVIGKNITTYRPSYKVENEILTYSRYVHDFHIYETSYTTTMFRIISSNDYNVIKNNMYIATESKPLNESKLFVKHAH